MGSARKFCKPRQPEVQSTATQARQWHRQIIKRYQPQIQQIQGKITPVEIVSTILWLKAMVKNGHFGLISSVSMIWPKTIYPNSNVGQFSLLRSGGHRTAGTF